MPARVRAGERLHPVDLGDLGEERLDHLTHCGVLDPGVGFEHDVADLACALTVEAVVEDVDAALALDVGQGEVGAVARTRRTHHGTEHDEAEHPDEEHPAAAAEGHLSQTLQHDTSFRDGRTALPPRFHWSTRLKGDLTSAVMRPVQAPGNSVVRIRAIAAPPAILPVDRRNRQWRSSPVPLVTVRRRNAPTTGAVLWRTTNSVGRTRWRARVLRSPRARSIAVINACAAALPFAPTSWRTVVDRGARRLAAGLSSNPTTERSSGTASPSSAAASTTPNASTSEKHSTAVGRSGATSSVVAAS